MFDASRYSQARNLSITQCASFLAALSFLTISGQAVAAMQSTADLSPIAQTSVYRIQPDDVLNITVLGQEDLTKTVTVLSDGSIAFPCLGTAHVAGLTLPQLQKQLITAISAELVNPQVTVGVSQTHVSDVSVLGAVKQPGKVPMKQGWHVLDAIAAAGGLSVDKPEYVSATLVRSGTQVMPVDIAQLMDGTPDQSALMNLPIVPGDVLLIQQRDPGVTQVQVLGEVAHPGYYPASPTGSISAVLSEAGGTDADAELSDATVIHNGASKSVDLSQLVVNGSVSSGVNVMPGDTLVIPQNKRWYAVYGAVDKPGYIVYPDGQNVTVLTALSQAGGQTVNADLAKATLVTVTNGQESSVKKLDLQALIARGDASQNVNIPSDSILYIPIQGEKNRAHITDLFPLAAFLNAVRF